MKRHPSAFCHSPPSRSRRWLAPLAITAAFAACLEPDKPGDCDDGADCLLVEDSASSSGSDAKPASAFIPPPPGGLVNTAVNSGWTEGSFSVGHGGAAEYALPLWVPDGRRGHQPSLSLHYSSQGGNGLVGVGWSLSGLSSIAPCPRTLAQDGERRKVQHTAADVYCLDGQRLRPTGPMNWPEDLDMEYRTEEDSFARIIAQWAPNPDPFGSPQPSYFKVWTKDGRILTFGGDASSRVSASRFHGIDPDDPSFTPSGGRAIAAWRLSQVDDRNGNSIAIEYEKVEAQGTMWSLEMVPRRITYGPDRQVDFVYEGRPDPIDSFQPGASAAIHIRLARRLKTIQMRAGTELLREYRLVYASNSITARSLLKSITECDRNGVCLLPLQFDWALGSYAFGVIDTNVTDVGVSTASKNRFIAADINGDGRDDLVYGDAQNQWKMRFSDGAGGFTDGDLTGIPRAQEATYAPRIHPIDYNRDSRLDLLVEVPHPQSGTKFALYRSNGSGFQAAADIDSLALGGPGSGGVHEAYFLDLDGNGFTDYVAPQNSTVGLLRWRYRLNLGASFAPIQVTSLFSNFNGTYVRATDFDGDGRSNLLIGAFDHQAALQYEGALSVSSSYINLPFNHPPETVDHKNLHFADVNGDGLEDAVYPFSGLAVQLNSGRGFSEILPGASEYVSPADPSNGTYDRNVRIVDFNNDGSDDVLVFHPGTPSGPTDYDSGFQLYVWRANQFVRIPLGRPAPTSEAHRQATQALDFNGDGAVDLAQVWTSSTPFLRLLRREGGIPDRLVRVNVGTLGPRVEVDYSNLADPAVHAPGVCILPLICPRRGGTLVRMHRLANGVDTGSPWRSFLHSYTAARMDPNGRGWLGFKTHQVLDTERGATTTVTFNNEARLNFAAAGAQAYAYPLVNRPIKIEYELEVQPPLDVQYRRVVNKRYDFAPAAVDGTYVVEPLTWRSESDRERRDGGDWVDLHSRSATLLYDDFGSVSQVTTVMPGSDRVDVLTHLNDEDSWIIGRLETKTTTSCTRPENVCQTRESALEYEDNGDLKAVTVEPNDDDFRLRTDFDYGTFGNITSITSANAEGESRAITVAYDSLDLYPTTTTNALGHISQVTVHSGLGVPLGHVDPNGVPSTMKHDWFGRPREAHFADGYFERYDTNGPLIHTTTVPAGPGTTIAGEVIVMDALGRVREHRVPAFGGGQSTVRASYDRLGRTEAISRPFITAENLHWTTYDYDYLDRLIASEAPDGETVTHEYVALETHSVNPNGVESYVVERGDGRIASRYEDDPDSTGWLETRFEYGPFGLVRRIEAADGTSQSMTYDRRGRRIEHVDPSAGTTSSTYNAFGELIDGIDGAGRPVQIQYDVLGRPTRITSPDGTATNTWDVSPFGKGRLYEGKSADGVVTRHHYDDSGHHVRSTWNVEGAQYVVDFSHEIGRLASITYPALPGVTGRHKVDYIYSIRSASRVVTLVGETAICCGHGTRWTRGVGEASRTLARERADREGVRGGGRA